MSITFIEFIQFILGYVIGVVLGCTVFFRMEMMMRRSGNMAKMTFDEEGLLEEPCLSCDKARVEDIWHEWYCDEKECPYKEESEVKK